MPTGRDTPPNTATAAEVAAAHDLAQALRDLLGMHDRMKTVGVLPADYGIIAGRARAALAKASGEPT